MDDYQEPRTEDGLMEFGSDVSLAGKGGDLSFWIAWGWRVDDSDWISEG